MEVGDLEKVKEFLECGATGYLLKALEARSKLVVNFDYMSFAFLFGRAGAFLSFKSRTYRYFPSLDLEGPVAVGYLVAASLEPERPKRLVRVGRAPGFPERVATDWGGFYVLVEGGYGSFGPSLEGEEEFEWEEVGEEYRFPSEGITFEFPVLRPPFKEAEDIYGRPRRSRISELCRRCPNFSCEGYYRRDANYACLTFYSWKDGEIGLEEAVGIKYAQHLRHERTDKVRERIFKILAEGAESYEEKAEADFIASSLVKGVPLDEIERERRYFLYVDEGKWKRVVELLKGAGIGVRMRKIPRSLPKSLVEFLTSGVPSVGKAPRERRRERPKPEKERVKPLEEVWTWRKLSKKYLKYVRRMKEEARSGGGGDGGA